MSVSEFVPLCGFPLMTLLYVIQLLLAYKECKKPVTYVVSNEGEVRRDLIHHMDVKGLRSIWEFVILTVIFPVFLSVLSNLTAFSGTTSAEDSVLYAAYSTLYYLCLAVITVLITLEFSYLFSYKHEMDSEWNGLLLSALALDIIALVLLVFFVGHPTKWNISDLQHYTVAAFVITAIFAFLSSVLILLAVRTSALVKRNNPQYGTRGSGAKMGGH